jgi:hypothetical protein
MLFICINITFEDIYKQQFDNIDGKFRNQRLFEEVVDKRRRLWDESRRNNRKKAKETPTHPRTLSLTYQKHMFNIWKMKMIDENVIDNCKLLDVVKKAKKTIID